MAEIFGADELRIEVDGELIKANHVWPTITPEEDEKMALRQARAMEKMKAAFSKEDMHAYINVGLILSSYYPNGPSDGTNDDQAIRIVTLLKCICSAKFQEPLIAKEYPLE